jgi:hypothetical protein
VNWPGFDRPNIPARGILAAAWAALLLVSAAFADERFDWLTIGSTTYSNVTVLNKTRTDLFISHAWGMANIKVRDLDTDTQIKLGYMLPQEKESTSFFKPEEVLEKLDSNPQVQEVHDMLSLQAQPFLEEVGTIDDAYLHGFVAAVALVYLGWCFCCRLICKKTGQPPSALIWLPILKQFPMLKAAEMSKWWFLLNFIGLFGIRQIVWCFKISKVLGKNAFVGFLLVLPVTNIFAFLYLVLSGDGNGTKGAPPKVISLQGGERRQAA